MTRMEMRAIMRAAIERTRFKSSLPPGECDTTTVVAYLHRRREEIVAAALGALDKGSQSLSPEEVLSKLYREVADEDLPVPAAA